MARRLFTVGSFTPVAVADAANYTDAGYMGLMGGSSTQRIAIQEVFLGGQATASAPTIMLLARDSTVQATPTALATPNSDGPLSASAAALAAPSVSFVASTTKPQRSNSLTFPKLNLSFNPFGGVVKWQPPQGGEFIILGNTASLGEASISAFTGTVGLMGGTITYEPD
jgi:hypothetical protein